MLLPFCWRHSGSTEPSIYQPSVSLWEGLEHAPGPAMRFSRVMMWRARWPKMSFLSPVSIFSIQICRVPPDSDMGRGLMPALAPRESVSYVVYSRASRSSRKMRLRSPRRTMVAMGGPMRSRICERHSFRSRSGARYSVRVSVKPPVTCRVTIFSPFTDGPGEVKVLRTIINSIVSGIFIFPLVWAASGWENIVSPINTRAHN